MQTRHFDMFFLLVMEYACIRIIDTSIRPSFPMEEEEEYPTDGPYVARPPPVSWARYLLHKVPGACIGAVYGTTLVPLVGSVTVPLLRAGASPLFGLLLALLLPLVLAAWLRLALGLAPPGPVPPALPVSSPVCMLGRNHRAAWEA